VEAFQAAVYIQPMRYMIFIILSAFWAVFMLLGVPTLVLIDSTMNLPSWVAWIAIGYGIFGSPIILLLYGDASLDKERRRAPAPRSSFDAS